MEKTRSRDLYEINYRFGGLAEKIAKTQRIVLANRSKLGVRSAKDVGWIYV